MITQRLFSAALALCVASATFPSSAHAEDPPPWVQTPRQLSGWKTKRAGATLLILAAAHSSVALALGMSSSIQTSRCLGPGCRNEDFMTPIVSGTLAGLGGLLALFAIPMIVQGVRTERDEPAHRPREIAGE